MNKYEFKHNYISGVSSDHTHDRQFQQEMCWWCVNHSMKDWTMQQTNNMCWIKIILADIVAKCRCQRQRGGLHHLLPWLLVLNSQWGWVTQNILRLKLFTRGGTSDALSSLTSFQRCNTQRQKVVWTIQVRGSYQVISSVRVQACLFVLMNICHRGPDYHGNAWGDFMPVFAEALRLCSEVNIWAKRTTVKPC